MRSRRDIVGQLVGPVERYSQALDEHVRVGIVVQDDLRAELDGFDGLGHGDVGRRRRRGGQLPLLGVTFDVNGRRR